MDLVHLFLFTAVATAFLMLLRSFQTHELRVRISALAVLIVSGAAWLLARPLAGWIAIFAWTILLLIPALVQRRRMRIPFFQRYHFAVSPVVLILIIANVSMFAVETISGGSTNPFVLHRLGELDPNLVLYSHQYWRMFSALFLHYGPLHLFVNLLALHVLGSPLERQIGSLTFAACYLVSGIGSSLGVVLLTFYRILAPMQLVGASGCVMGIVGAWAGFLLRNRHEPMAMQRLRSVALIVFMQVAFDVSTPQVSMSAHLGGLVTGFLVSLAIPRRFARGT